MLGEGKYFANNATNDEKYRSIDFCPRGRKVSWLYERIELVIFVTIFAKKLKKEMLQKKMAFIL